MTILNHLITVEMQNILPNIADIFTEATYEKAMMLSKFGRNRFSFLDIIF